MAQETRTLDYAGPAITKPSLLFAPPGKWILAVVLLYWLLVLITHMPIMTMVAGIISIFAGLAISGMWFCRLAIWVLGILLQHTKWTWRDLAVALAPALVAIAALTLMGFNVPTRLRFVWYKPELVRLATDVLTEPADTAPDRSIGFDSFTDIHKASGGFVCVVASDVHTWGFAYFAPPLVPPAGLYCTPLGDGWYFWQD